MTRNFSETLNYWLSRKGLTHGAFAELYGSKQQNISELITKERVTTKVLGKVTQALNISLDEFWERREHEDRQEKTRNILPSTSVQEYYSGNPIPFYDVIVTGGNVALFSDNREQPSGYLNAPAFSDCIAVQLSGDSMDPIYKSGDILFIREKKDWRNFINWGHAYLIVTNEERMVKYVHPGQDKYHWVLKSTNPQFPDGEIPVNLILRVFIVKGRIRQDAM